MTVVRHLLFCLLVFVGFTDIRAVSAEVRATEPWAHGHSVAAGMPFAQCGDRLTTTPIEITAPAELLPDLLPPEREGDSIGRPPSGGVTAVRFAEARSVPVDCVVERRPGNGFSSRAPPTSS